MRLRRSLGRHRRTEAVTFGGSRARSADKAGERVVPPPGDAREHPLVVPIVRHWRLRMWLSKFLVSD